MLAHPSAGACDGFVGLFHVLYCSGSMCVGVTVRFGWGGVVSLCGLQHA
jgi:sugar phosphate permease